MLSRDAAGLDPRSSTAGRWRCLRDVGADLTVLVASRSEAKWTEQGISVRGSGGGMMSRFFRLKKLAASAVAMADVVTSQDPFELGWIAFRVARRARKPFELQDHGGFFDGQVPDEPLWALRGRLARFLAARAQSVRTVSPQSLAFLNGILGGRAYWLPIAADARFASLERHPEAGLLVTVSRLVRVKRVDLLLQGFARLRARTREARLVVVGDGPERAALEALAKSLNISSAVTFVGAADPAPWLSKASVFASVSQHEGWGVAAIEAAMAGVPVVLTETGCASWLAMAGAANKVPREVTPELLADAFELAEEVHVKIRPTLDLPTQEQAARLQVEAWRRLLNR